MAPDSKVRKEVDNRQVSRKQVSCLVISLNAGGELDLTRVKRIYARLRKMHGFEDGLSD
jgi:hypothetical protein